MSIKIPIVTVFDNKGLKNAQSAIGKVGSGIKGAFKVGAAATAAVGALTGIGVQFAKAAEQAQVANNRLDQVAKSMGIFGNDTKQVTDRLKAYADTNMLVMGIDDEVIKSTQAKLLTFKELAASADTAGGAFDRATQAAFDLAAAGFGSAETNATQLGKALQDPIKGLTALTRSGVTFTEVEREKIKALVDSGQTLQAQDMILSAIENQVGGTAAATATASQKMSVAFGEMSESIGTAILPAFEKLTEIVTSSFVPAAEALTPIFTTLFSSLAPIIEKALPIFIKILEALTPIITTLLKALEPILDALSPLADVFMMVMEAIAPIIEMAMPIFIKLVQLLAPIIAKLVAAFIPLVEKLLPPILKLFEALIPIIEILADLIITYIVPYFMKLVDIALPPLIWLIENFTRGIENLTAFLVPLYDALKPVYNALFAIAGIKPGELDKTITVTTKMGGSPAAGGPMGILPTTPKAGGLLGGLTGGGGGGGAGSKSDPTGLKAWTATAKEELKLSRRETKLVAAGLGADVAASLASSGLDTVSQALKRVNKNGQKAINNLTKTFQNSAAGQQAAAASAAAAAEAVAAAAAEAAAATEAAAEAVAEAARKETEALAERNRVYQSFADSVASTFANIKESILGAFSLPSLGGSTDSIIRNMDKLLTRVKAFSSNITKLSSMGLDPKLLAQVISAGPVEGAKLAASLVAGGVSGLSAINRGYAELGNVAGEIGMTGTQSLFGTQAQQTIYNVNINGGLDSGASIGKAVVDAVRAYERTSGPVWQGA
jgi:phage-related protein